MVRTSTAPAAGGQSFVQSLATPEYLPTSVFFGPGALKALPGILAAVMARTGAVRVVLVTGKPAVGKPWQEQVRKVVSEYPHSIAVNPRVNPSPASVAAVAAQCGPPGGALFVALGGGSVIDTAKSVAAIHGSGRSLEELLRDPTDLRAAPLVVIPTTAGSGSEVTPTATLWEDEALRKASLTGSALFPQAAVVDPDVTMSLPAEQVAATGLDALAQAVEGAWAVQATEESACFALDAVQRLAAHLVPRHRALEGAESRAEVSLGALLAGIAIARSRTTAAHAISYPLTARWGVPHGHACALSLGTLFRYNAEIDAGDCQDPRGPDHVRRTLKRLAGAIGAARVEDAAARLDAMVPLLGLRRLRDIAGIDADVIANDVAGYDRLRNNPRAIDRGRLLGILAGISRAS